MTKSKRGGAGRGQGRKQIKAGEYVVPVSVRLTEDQRSRLTDLGGAAWVRNQIDYARPGPLTAKGVASLQDILAESYDEGGMPEIHIVDGGTTMRIDFDEDEIGTFAPVPP